MLPLAQHSTYKARQGHYRAASSRAAADTELALFPSASSAVQATMADIEPLQTLTAALQACSAEPPTAGAGTAAAARAALGASDAAAQALLRSAADPTQNGAALEDAVRCAAGVALGGGNAELAATIAMPAA